MDKPLVAQENLFEHHEHTFSTALILLKEGRKMRRIGWSSPGMWVGIVRCDTTTLHGQSVVHRPYFIMLTRDGDLAVWFPAICDLLANDWVVVE